MPYRVKLRRFGTVRAGRRTWTHVLLPDGRNRELHISRCLLQLCTSSITLRYRMPTEH
jgi:hypothetical protein